MNTKISIEDVTVVGSYRYVVEASDIGLAAGQWPEQVDLVGGGNGQALTPIRDIRDNDELVGIVYLQQCGCIELTVFKAGGSGYR